MYKCTLPIPYYKLNLKNSQKSLVIMSSIGFHIIMCWYVFCIMSASILPWVGMPSVLCDIARFSHVRSHLTVQFLVDLNKRTDQLNLFVDNPSGLFSVFLCVCVCVCACVRACARACLYVIGMDIPDVI